MTSVHTAQRELSMTALSSIQGRDRIVLDITLDRGFGRGLCGGAS